MQDTETQQLLLNILTYAQERKYTEIHPITTWAEFKLFCNKKRATKIIIKTLYKASKNLFKTYCRDVAAGSADFTKLLAYSELQEVIAFYERDLILIKRMLDEYDNYLGQGHFWYSFLGGKRQL